MSDATLREQVAIISGALGDIGRAIARSLAREGASIALGDVLDPSRAVPLLEELRGLGVAARYDRADVADASAVRAWVASVEREMGVPTLIVPNAAVVAQADIRTVTPEHWRREMSINLDGAFHLAQVGAQRLLAARRPGRIVFVGSWAAHAPHPAIPAYCVAKAGLRALCRCMAIDLASSGILVNEVAPGYVDAGVSADIFAKQPEARQNATRRVPIGLLVTPDDVAREVAHLCSPENRHTTGATVLLDGGLSLVRP